MSARLLALLSQTIVDLKCIRKQFSEWNEDDHHSSGAMMTSAISSISWQEILRETECLKQKLQLFLEGLHGLDKSVPVKLEQLPFKVEEVDGNSEINTMFEPDILKLEPNNTEEAALDTVTVHDFETVRRETISLRRQTLDDGHDGSDLHVTASSNGSKSRRADRKSKANIGRKCIEIQGCAKSKEISRRGRREACKETKGGVLPYLGVTVGDTPQNDGGGRGSERGSGRGCGRAENAPSECIVEKLPKRMRKMAGEEEEEAEKRRKRRTLKLGLASSNVANEKTSESENAGTTLVINSVQCASVPASVPAVVAPGVGGATAEELDAVLESNEDFSDSAGDRKDRKDRKDEKDQNFAASSDDGTTRESTIFVCDICGAEFRGRDYWLRHIKEHGKQGCKFECDICHKEFKGLESMKNHKRLLHKSERFPCEFCDEKFSQKTLLKTHLRVSHRDDPNCRLICHLCGQRFAEESQHEEHMNTHLAKSRNFECDICHKRFTCSGNMKSHKKRIHNPARKKTVQCSYCAMMFYHESVCMTHQAFVHEKRKDFQCSFCPRKFPSLQSALIHERSHTGQKPYACEFQGCGKYFGDRTNLRNHQVTHTGIKPYKCDACEAGFMRKKQLQDHQQNRCPAGS